MNFFTIKWQNGSVVMIDQRLLPNEEVYRTFHTPEQVADAIRTMVIRGAPAIGVAGAFGMALAAQNSHAQDAASFQKEMNQAADLLIRQRPTAVNLPWAVKRIQQVYATTNDFSGPVSVEAGTLKVGTSAALGSTNGGTTIANGATLDVGGNATANLINLGFESAQHKTNLKAGEIVNSGVIAEMVQRVCLNNEDARKVLGETAQKIDKIAKG